MESRCFFRSLIGGDRWTRKVPRVLGYRPSACDGGRKQIPQRIRIGCDDRMGTDEISKAYQERFLSLHATFSCDGSSAGTWTFAPPSLKRDVSSPVAAVATLVCCCLRCGCFGWSILRPFRTHPVRRTIRIGRGDTFPSPSPVFSLSRVGPMRLPSASLSSALLVHPTSPFPKIHPTRSIAPDRVLSRRMGGGLGSQVHDHRIWSHGPSKDWSHLPGWDVDLWLRRRKTGLTKVSIQHAPHRPNLTSSSHDHAPTSRNKTHAHVPWPPNVRNAPGGPPRATTWTQETCKCEWYAQERSIGKRSPA